MLFSGIFALALEMVQLDEPAQLHYQLLIAPAPVERVHGHLRITGLDPDEEQLNLYMVRRYALVALPAPLLVGQPQVVDSQGQTLALESLDPYRWKLDKGSATEIEISWVVSIEHRRQASVPGSSRYQFPYLSEDHGMLTTSAILLVPEQLDFSPPLLTIETPDGWPVHGPWPQIAPGVFRPKNEYALVSNFFGVGAWDQAKVDAPGVQVTLLFAPGQRPLRELIMPLVTPILRAELELFQVQPFEHYTVLFGQVGEAGLGGSPKQGSMTMYAETRLWNEAGASPLVHLLAHEFFHTWGHVRYRCPDELRFFNEGFTDYYARLVPARLGSAPWFEFAEAIETALAQWERNPASQHLSLVSAGGPAFFNDTNAYQLVYSGGLVLAALTDLYLRNRDLRVDGRSGNLDELMRSFNNDPRWSLEGRAPRLRNLRLALAERLGHSRARTLISYAFQPGVPDLPAAFAAAGTALERDKRAPSNNLRANLDGPVIRSLASDGLAARIGLQPGDRVRRINGQDIFSERELRSAWGQIDSTILVEIIRGQESMLIEQTVPKEIHYRLPLDAWDPERAAPPPRFR